MKKLSTFLSFLLFAPAAFANPNGALGPASSDVFNQLSAFVLGPWTQAMAWLMLIGGIIGFIRHQRASPLMSGIFLFMLFNYMPAMLSTLLGDEVPTPAPDSNPLQLLAPVQTAFTHLMHSRPTPQDNYYLLGLGIGLLVLITMIVFSAISRNAVKPTLPRRVIDLGKH